MKYFNPLFLLLLVCLSIPALAQETIIYGVVRDPDANEKLIGVTVQVDNGEGQPTDAEGKYRLNVAPGSHKLVFTYIGYEKTEKTVNVKAGEIKQVNANLIQSREELNVVVVSASQYEKKLSQETVSMDVIPVDLIKNTNTRDLGEALAKTPGVVMQDGQISIRGGSSYSYGVGSRVAVMVDGQNFMSADLGEAQLKFAPIENVEQVEVIKGASSVVYGSAALNGVVNMITAWPKGDKPTTDVSLYSGIYTKPPIDELVWWEGRQPGYMGVLFNHRRKIKNLQLVFGGNVDMVQSFLQSADEFRGRFNWKTRYVLPKKPGISFGINGTVMQETSGRFFISQDLDTNAYRINKGSSDSYVRTSIDPHFTMQNNRGHRYELRFRYLNVWRRGNGDDINASSNSFDIQNQYQYKFKTFLVVTAGIPFSFGISESNLYSGKRLNYAGAGYVQVDGIYKKLIINVGVRYEINRVDTLIENSIPVFRTGLSFQPGKASFLRASWGQGYRLPSIGERFIAEPFSSLFIVPNPDLLPEKSWNAEVGFKQGFRIRNWNALFDVAVFWSEYKNFVEYDIGRHSNFYANGDSIFPDEHSDFVLGMRPANIENARIFGWELSLQSKGNIGPVNITTLIGYTYSFPGNLAEADSQNVGQFVSNAFKYFGRRIEQADTNAVAGLLLFRSRHVIRGDIELGYKKFSIGYTLSYNSFPEKFGGLLDFAGRLLTGQDSYENYITDHKGDLYMDTRLAYQVTEKVKISVMCKNFTNAFYFQRPAKVEPPRSIVIQANIKF